LTGTLGVISKAKQKGIIAEVEPLIEKLISKGFWISKKIISSFLKANGENPNV
jgi:predicted nucleic acid-binding protein